MAEIVTVDLDMTRLEKLLAKVPLRPVVRYVADGVNYGVHQEFGTHKTGAHPFMIPAVEEVRPSLLGAWGQVASLENAEDVVEKAARDVEAKAKHRAPVDTGALKNSIHVSKTLP